MNKLILVLAIGLAGCATQGQWMQEGKTLDDLTRDKYECQGQARQYVSDSGYTGNIFLIAERESECMRVKGYNFVRR